jgi:RNA polymerase sigma factor (sigma-70 family)
VENGEASMASVQTTRLAKKGAKECTNWLSDQDLLEEFLGGEGFESEVAFRTLVVRHGPMVLGICRHVLIQHADAEDAFQATFFVLARNGASIRNRSELSGWLCQVAYRTAFKLRVCLVRRQNLERQGVAMSHEAIEYEFPEERAAWNELRPVLHEEVNRLPEKFRIPVILSYLEGKTNEEVAALLQWPVGTVKGRLSRARALLRSRLTRRGALSAAFLVTALSEGTVLAEVVPAELIERTVRAVQKFCPRPAPPQPSSASTQPLTESRFPPWNETLVDTHRKLPKLARHPFVTLISVFSVSAVIAIGLAAYLGGKSSSLRSALSAFVPVRATSASCH